MACASSSPVRDDGNTLGLPSPLAGPHAPALAGSEKRHIERGWTRLTEGDLSGARARAVESGAGPASRLLLLQSDVLDGEDLTASVTDLLQLTDDRPDYASAWATLSIAAERADDEATALAAARRTASLWDRDRWSGRVRDLYQRWVDDRIADGNDRLANGDAESALELARRARELVPDERDATILEARSLTELGRADEAESILAPLANDPAALQIAATIAEDRDDWMTAMDLYAALPADSEGRDAALRRVKLRWRLSVLPPYVSEAIASPDLTRSQLAAILVDLAPEIETLEGGKTPVLTDVVDLPMQREVLTALRLGLMTADDLEPRFHPDRLTTLDEVHTAIEALVHLVGWSEPVWCTEDMLSSNCIQLANPVSGEALTDVVLRLAQGES